MELITGAFPHAAYESLPPKVREFFLNLSHARNDLRIPLYLIFQGSNGVKKTEGVDHAASAHYFQYALRLSSATMFEVWLLLDEGLGRADVEAAIGGRLSQEMNDEIAELRAYFADKGNTVRRIRNKMAFHFDPKELGKALPTPADGHHRFVTGKTIFNPHFLFAEEAASRVLFGVDPADDRETAQAKVRSVSDEISGLILKILGVCDAVIFAFLFGGGGGLDVQTTGRCEVSPIKVRELMPPLFADEDPEEIRLTFAERGVRR